jgi:hypothetical protein
VNGYDPGDLHVGGRQRRRAVERDRDRPDARPGQVGRPPVGQEPQAIGGSQERRRAGRPPAIEAPDTEALRFVNANAAGVATPREA